MSLWISLSRLFYRTSFFFFSTLQAIYWALYGLSTPDPKKNEGATIREMKVIYRYKPHELDNVFSEDFVCVHQQFITPDQFLKKTNVSLYTIENDKVVFVECDPKVDLTTAHPFFYIAQFLHAQKVFEMSHEDFERLAQRVYPSVASKNIIMVYSTGRCGSTLLSQMFDKLNDSSNEKQGELISVSEPDSLTRLAGFAAKNHPRYRSLLKSSLTFLFHGLGDRNVQTLVVKTKAQVFQIAEDIQNEYPTIHPLFMYRDGMNYIMSSLRSFQDTGVFALLNLCLKYPLLRKTILSPFWFIVRSFAIPKGYEAQYGSDSYLSSLPIPAYLALFYISIVSRYLDFKNGKNNGDEKNHATTSSHRNLSDMRAIRYQDLVAKPKEFCEELFRVCGLIGSHGITEENLEERIQTVMQVMKKDSQCGTALFSSRENHQELNLSDDDKKSIHDVFSRHPTVNTFDFILPHTLLH